MAIQSMRTHHCFQHSKRIEPKCQINPWIKKANQMQVQSCSGRRPESAEVADDPTWTTFSLATDLTPSMVVTSEQQQMNVTVPLTPSFQPHHYPTIKTSMRQLIPSLFTLLLIMASGSVAFSSPSVGDALSHKRVKISHYYTELHSSSRGGNNSTEEDSPAAAGKLEELKQKEAELSKLLAAVRREKLTAIRSRPLTIGVMGFGRFGQFIARTFQKYGRVVVTSRSDYTDIANGMGVKYVPLSTLDAFLQEDLDVIVVATSILSFRSTIESLVPHLQKKLMRRAGKGDLVKGPLIVDVLSVKEHARQTMLDLLPVECDILCTHPMFGPDSGKDGWHGLNFVYEKTRIDKVVLEQNDNTENKEAFVDSAGQIHNVHEDNEGHVEAMDRMERFLSIWEEEGCRMVPMSAKDHDAHAANSQFITHLMGRILGSQGLAPTPIDTKGFQSVLKLIGSTTADSFDLFYGLYKFNQNSLDTIVQLRSAMDEVVDKLQVMEDEEQQKSDEIKKSVPS